MSFDSSRSANSGGKSRRSFASNTTSNSDKKRKPNQKTLGMAWGANSLSSSKSKSNSSSRASPFSDFGSYMVEKNRKLTDQFNAVAASSSSLGGDSNSKKPLFHGVSIFVDGFTVPSSQELRGYMLRYGGRFENYFSRHRVTHIICSNLPDSKIKNLRSFCGGLPVLKPTWVLDCVAANKLLNWVPYQLDQLVDKTQKQPKLSSFFSIRSGSTSDNAETLENQYMEPNTEGSSLRDVMISELPSCEVGESFDYVTECSPEASSGQPCKEIKETCNFVDEKVSELRTEEESCSDTKDERSVPEAEALKYSPCRSSASANDSLDNQNINQRCNRRSAVTSTSNKCHSTLGDPNFVENYFKKSRLHFIGTWRNRYRKRFPSLPSGFKYGNPTVSSPTGPTAIIHVDMDCFFVSVVIRNHPDLQDKPVAVCHSDNPRGTAEISSANYPARDYGVSAGIFVRDAKALCPHLVIIPYNFEAYEEVADQFYNILHKHCNKVQAVSCDEAFLDFTDRKDEDPEHIASVIREEIVKATGCTASAGIAGNLLMARLATRAAKPNGQCYISPGMVESFLDDLPIKALPGIGHVLEEKLKKQHIQTCSQLRMLSKESLQKDFGTKIGDMLWNYSRGIDNRCVGEVQETKSVGAEVNWGVRFNDLKDSHNFLVSLCNEVSLRLQGCGVLGRTITLKVKKRRNNAEDPTKYMGCGDCENLSHSTTVPMATDDVEILQRISKQLFGSFHLDVKEIRGVGLQVSRLESADIARQGHEKNALKSWLTSAPVNTEEHFHPLGERVDEGTHLLDGQSDTTIMNRGKQVSDGNSGKFISSSAGLSCKMHTNQRSGETSTRASTLPPLHDLDMEVIKSLPPEIFSEVNSMYGGKLSDFLKVKVKDERITGSICTSSVEKSEGVGRKLKEPYNHYFHSDKTMIENKKSSNFIAEKALEEHKEEALAFQDTLNQSILLNVPSVAAPVSGTSSICITSADIHHADIMPVSLSQVDKTVLQQLPDDLKVDILELLPAHRKPEYFSDFPIGSAGDSFRDIARNENHTEGLKSISRNHYWVGDPPEWVVKFGVSNYLVLNLLSEMYHKSGPACLLSSILQGIISMRPLFVDESNDGEDESIISVCELLQQYIKLNIKKDMEEIYVSFRLLKRFSRESRFFFQVYDRVLPYLQVSFAENYGGNLNI